MGDMKNATDAFTQALILNPRAQMPAEITRSRPSSYGKAHLRASEAATGRLGIFSSPQMAEVWLDGHYRGVTPLQLDQLPAGRHFRSGIAGLS